MLPTLPVAPATQALPHVPDPQLPRFSRAAAVAAVLVSSPIVAVVAFAFLTESPFFITGDWWLLAFGGFLAAAFVGICIAVVAVVRLGRVDRDVRSRGRWLGVFAAASGPLYLAFVTLVAWELTHWSSG